MATRRALMKNQARAENKRFKTRTKWAPRRMKKKRTDTFVYFRLGFEHSLRMSCVSCLGGAVTRTARHNASICGSQPVCGYVGRRDICFETLLGVLIDTMRAQFFRCAVIRGAELTYLSHQLTMKR